MNIDPVLVDEMESLVSAEDFLEFFSIPFEQNIVHTNRLHILQRFHDYLSHHANEMPDSTEKQRIWHRDWLEQAYHDFVSSSAQKEKVFRVFRDTPSADGGTSTFTPIEEIFKC